MGRKHHSKTGIVGPELLLHTLYDILFTIPHEAHFVSLVIAICTNTPLGKEHHTKNS